MRTYEEQIKSETAYEKKNCLLLLQPQAWRENRIWCCTHSKTDIIMGKKSEAVVEKRQIPQVLRGVLQLDALLTDKFCGLVEKIVPSKWRAQYKALEISCHGIPWIAGWLAFIWLWNSPSLYQMQVNFFIGLLLDVLVVAVVKAITRRRRPKGNRSDMFASMSVDKFSFPSGHATRACYIAHFFSSAFVISPLRLPLILWSSAVCVSRILLHRHHILDVVAGAAIGVLESIFISYMWISEEWSLQLLSMITDEKLEGGEYHV
ncbi:phospholipid phosphatase 6-like [Thrips palmi]|uniref:Phospholipid phosphatase 6-like n=1 Tax=Thrips palmi TaxID=161013 RepID=A0A6P9ACU4_THRPL|nr:phospholipid phosphatase 6-like [Thrips palmi]